MERRQQERLVGAVVVVVAAAIVVPWLLDGSPERWAAQGHGGVAEPRLQRRTVDLREQEAGPIVAEPTPNRSPTPAPVTPAQDSVSAQAVEPVEAISPVVSPEPDDPSSAAGGDAPAPATPAASAATNGAQAVAPEALAREEETPVVARLAQTDAAPAPPGVETGWAVQVGSFRKRANAQGLADRLSGKGYRAFLSRHTRGEVVWYRVRVGTEQTRAAAGDIAARLRRDGQVTTLVQHP